MPKNQPCYFKCTHGRNREEAFISEYMNNFEVFFLLKALLHKYLFVLQFVMFFVFAIVIIQMLGGTRLLLVECHVLPCIC